MIFLFQNKGFKKYVFVKVQNLKRTRPLNHQHLFCRNPTFAKCGGEAQHLEKVRIWSPPGLSNV